MYKEIILSKVLEYIKLRKIVHRGSAACLTFTCPLCNASMAATKLRNMQRCKCNSCNQWFDLIVLARKIENLPSATDEEILTKLRNDLNTELYSSGLPSQ